jgi:hypothetical protein
MTPGSGDGKNIGVTASLVPLLLIGLAAYPITAFMRYSHRQLDTKQITQTAEILAARARSEHKIVLVLDQTGATWGRVWGETIGAIAILHRQGNHSVCIHPRSWHLLFHLRYRCDDVLPADALVLNVTAKENVTDHPVIAPLISVAIVRS